MYKLLKRSQNEQRIWENVGPKLANWNHATSNMIITLKSFNIIIYSTLLRVLFLKFLYFISLILSTFLGFFSIQLDEMVSECLIPQIYWSNDYNIWMIFLRWSSWTSAVELLEKIPHLRRYFFVCILNFRLITNLVVYWTWTNISKRSITFMFIVIDKFLPFLKPNSINIDPVFLVW